MEVLPTLAMTRRSHRTQGVAPAARSEYDVPLLLHICHSRWWDVHGWHTLGIHIAIDVPEKVHKTCMSRKQGEFRVSLRTHVE